MTQDFVFLSGLVREQSGIVVEPGKEYLIETRLMPVANAAGLKSLSELANTLRRTPKGILADKVVDAMTTNETTFFRDFFPFEALKKSVLPELMRNRSATKEINIWCAASSSGQEPFSLAMLILENFPQLAMDWKLQFIATDISKEMLDRCQKGAYSQLEVNRGLPAALLARYFTQVSGAGSNWVLSEKVRKLVQFRMLNLIDGYPPMGQADIVLIRNVLIYFDLATKKKILAKIRKILKPDGYLFLGGSETTMNVDEGFTRVQFDKAGCYRLASPLAK
jgi:chemotaxis protein methyltransferase CheR